jgi:hypothetical protein
VRPAFRRRQRTPTKEIVNLRIRARLGKTYACSTIFARDLSDTIYLEAES